VSKLIALVVTALLCAVLPAASAATPIVLAEDRWGDVRIERQDGLGPRARQSIDLRRLIVTAVDDGIRFEIRLRRVTTGTRFDQFFFIDFTNSEEFGQVHIRAARMRGEVGLEGAPTPQGFAFCRVTPEVNEARTRLAVVVPLRCVPVDEADVEVSVYTTPLDGRGGRVLFSQDELVVPGRVDLSPATE